MVAVNFPQQVIPFIGRETELIQIKRLLTSSECHLLTLMGAGGIGKTRMAVEAACQLTFHDGVYFVPLQPINSAELLVTTIADTLHYQFHQTGSYQQQLCDYLQDKSLLLVLDNFEQLLDGSGLLAAIISQAANVRLLVTSRERLNLQEEWVLELDGLPYPMRDDESEIEGYSAVELFLEQARRTNVNFTLVEAQKPDLVRICRLVSGMPLALELAAVWVRSLSCTALADEIERGLGILETSTRNIAPRHRSMRAAFAPTWNRLTEDERGVFQKLSIFRGGFTREAAEQVAAASLATLTALVDKSLLRINADGRYGIQELLRQFSEEYLQRSEELDTARNAHSRYYLEFMRQREADIKGRRQQAGLNEIAADLENVRAAWYWAVEQKGFNEIGQALESMLWFMAKRSHYIEGEALFRYARDHLAPQPEEPKSKCYNGAKISSTRGELCLTKRS